MADVRAKMPVGTLEAVVDRVAARELDPYTAAAQILASRRGGTGL
jgi:hypothetical protein